MKTPYTARAYRNPGRKSFVISFRHPGQSENGRPGRKVCRGLGTESEKIAQKLEDELKALLARPDLHSLAGRAEAARIFDERIVEIFYSQWEPAVTSHRAVRERLMPLPKADQEYVRTLLLGVTGAGKSTLLRRLIGSNADRDRFPATSVNRTTTCEIEVVTGRENYSAVVTFLTRHQTEQEIIESLSNSLLKAIEGASDDAVATEFLDPSGQRFRLKYVLGGWKEQADNEDHVFSFEDAASPDRPAPSSVASKFLAATIKRLRAIGIAATKEVEAVLGPLHALKADERDYALDEMQQVAEQSDDFLDLVADVMEEIGERFSALGGDFIKSSTGWPDAWKLSLPSERRDEFIAAVRSFCGTSREQWGQLVTPLVTGIRVCGPFRPAWVPSDAEYRHVFIDTEGLLHARTTTEVPNELTSLFKDVNIMLLVESAKNALHSPTAGKVFEAVASTGYTSKFAVVFTHMDAVSGDNLTTAASKRAHVFGGIRSVLDGQVARTVSRDAARQLGDHLQSNTFYFAYLDSKRYPTLDKASVEAFETRIGNELWRLTEQLVDRCRPQVLQPAFPQFSFEALGLAVQEVSVEFLTIYDARLGYRRLETISEAPWQSIKAMSRRYAEGWFDGFWLNPIDTLISVIRNVLTRFLEAPLGWDGKRVNDEEKAAIVNRIKQVVDDSLTEIGRSRLWKVPQPNWQSAYGIRGAGSTFTRKGLVRDIFQHQVPVPQSISNRWAQAWVEEIKQAVVYAIAKVKAEQESSGTNAGELDRRHASG